MSVKETSSLDNIFTFWNESEKSLNQTHDLSNPINKCERDKFTWKYFRFLDESEKSLSQTRCGGSCNMSWGRPRFPCRISMKGQQFTRKIVNV